MNDAARNLDPSFPSAAWGLGFLRMTHLHMYQRINDFAYHTSHLQRPYLIVLVALLSVFQQGIYSSARVESSACARVRDRDTRQESYCLSFRLFWSWISIHINQRIKWTQVSFVQISQWLNHHNKFDMSVSHIDILNSYFMLNRLAFLSFSRRIMSLICQHHPVPSTCGWCPYPSRMDNLHLSSYYMSFRRPVSSDRMCLNKLCSSHTTQSCPCRSQRWWALVVVGLSVRLRHSCRRSRRVQLRLTFGMDRLSTS